MDDSPGLTVTYAQTAAEISASVTPTNSAYPELYFERYGGGVSASASANNTAMTSALNVANARGGGILNFPSAGTYSFSSTTAFALPVGLVIQGTGAETILSYSGSGTFFIIQSGNLASPNNVKGGRNELRDIYLLGPGGGTADSTLNNNAGFGLQIGDSGGDAGLVMMRRVTMNGFGTAMVVGGLIGGRFEMCEFGGALGGSIFSNNVGIDFDFAASTNQVDAVTFSDCIVAQNGNAGVQATSTPIRMNSIRWNGCTVQDNCLNITTNPQFYMGVVGGFEITGLYMEGTSSTEAIRSDYMSQGLIADFYIDGCSYGIHDHGGGSMNQVDIIDGVIGGTVGTAAIYMASEFDVVARNVNTSAAVTLTGTGCSYLKLGSGLASWPATDLTMSPTPTLTGTGGSATYTGTGGYSKVGNIVNFNISIVTSASTLTGPIQVGGLPIDSASTLSAIFVVQCIGITPSGSNNQFYGKLAPSSESIAIWGGGTAAPAQVQGAALAGATTINITGSYQAAS
jgi:hypothetical protein